MAPPMIFTPKSTEGMTAEEVEAAKAREREEFPLVTLTSPDTLAPEARAQVEAFLAKRDSGEAVGLPAGFSVEYLSPS